MTAIFMRELKLAANQGWSAVLGFFLIVILSFMLSAEASITPYAAGLIWAALLLAHILILPRFFEDDLAHGALDIMRIEVQLPALIIIAKIAAIWLVMIVPLILLVPVGGVMLGLEADALPALTLSALIGSLGLVCLNCFAAALTSGLRAALWLAPLIILPLQLPLLIFGAAAARQPIEGFFSSPPSLLLIGLTLLAIAIAPWLSAFALSFDEEI